MKKNIIANFFGKFWSLLSGFIFIPLYIRFLGFESYSIISFTLVVAGLMVVLDVGLTATLSREFARIDNSSDEKIRIFKTLESSYFIIIGLCIIIVFALSGFIANNWLVLKTFNPNRVSFFLKIISFDVGFQLLLRFYMGGLLGLEKQVKANIYQVGWGMLRNGLVVLGILIIPTLEVFFIWQTISTIVFTILIRLSLNKALTDQYKFDFHFNIERSVISRIWRFAGGMLLISLVASLNTQMDKLAISKLLPVESLGYYTLAVSLSMGVIVLVNPISIALLPRFTALYSAGKTDETSKLFHKVNLFVAILVFSVLANIAFFAKEIIWIWTGNMELAQNTYFLIPVIAFAYALLSLSIIPFNIAIANGYTKLNNLLGLISLFVTLPGYWLVTKNYGAIGTAYIFCGVQTTTTFIYLYLINKKFINTKRISMLFIKQILLPLLITLSIALGFSFIPDWAAQNRIYAFAWIGVSTTITLVITTLVLIPISEIKQIVYFRAILEKET
jgi:O-antigen/teichoic acid export membrane protein